MSNDLNRVLLSLLLPVLLAGCASMRPHTVAPETYALSDQVYEILAAELASKEADFVNAFRHYKKAAVLSGDSEVFAAAIALALHNRNYREAATIGEQWYRIAPDNPRLHQTMIVIYLQLAEYEKVIPHIEFSIDNNDNIFRQSEIRPPEVAHFNPAMGGITTIDKLLELQPDNTRLYLIRAMVAFHTGEYQRALEAAQYALSRDPSFTKAYAVMADALFGLDRVEVGLGLLHAQSALHPNHYQLFLKTARAFFLYDRDQLALELYRMVNAINDKDMESIYALGVLSLRQKKFDSARSFFTRFLELAKTEGEVTEAERATYYLGRVDEDEGRYAQAQARYQSIGQGAIFSEARVGIARVHGKMGRSDLVDLEFDSTRAQLYTDHERIAMFIAQAEVLKDSATQNLVFNVYARALQEYPNEPNLLYARALFAGDAGRIDLAEEDLKNIIKNDPSNWRALNALGYLLADANIKLREAKEYVRQAYKLQPNSAAILDSVGWVEFRLHNLSAAERYIKQAADMHVQPEILGHLAEVFWSQQKESEAFDVLKSGLDKFPENEYLQKLYRLKVE